MQAGIEGVIGLDGTPVPCLPFRFHQPHLLKEAQGLQALVAIPLLYLPLCEPVVGELLKNLFLGDAINGPEDWNEV